MQTNAIQALLRPANVHLFRTQLHGDDGFQEIYIYGLVGTDELQSLANGIGITGLIFDALGLSGSAASGNGGKFQAMIARVRGMAAEDWGTAEGTAGTGLRFHFATARLGLVVLYPHKIYGSTKAVLPDMAKEKG